MQMLKRILSLITVAALIAVSVPASVSAACADGCVVDPTRTIGTAATCEIGGWRLTFCKNCGEMIEYLTIDALGHNWEETDVPPTCKSEGYHLNKCTRDGCGEEQRSNYVDKSGHVTSDDPFYVITTEPTCTVDGSTAHLCIYCFTAVETEVIPSPGHTEVETLVPNTCTTMGYHIIQCSVCEEYIRNDVLDPTGHNWIEYDVEPTCLEQGYHAKDCTNEGCTQLIRTRYTDPVECRAATDPEKITVTATCTEDGELLIPCEWCGEILIREPASALGHTEGEAVVTLAPTCEEAGVSVTSCTVCNTVITTVVIEELGHDWLEIESGDADCTNAGYVVSECQREGCGKTEKIETEPALGHTPDRDNPDTVDPTCTARGRTTWPCSVCGLTAMVVYTDPLGHDWSKEHVDGGCLGESYDLSTCQREGCGETERSGVTAAPGHDWSEERVDGGCVGESYIIRTCLRDGCGETEREDFISPGHTVSEDEAEWIVVEADCLNGGSVTKPCTVCGQAAEVTETKALGHDWDEKFTDGGCMGVSTLTKTCLRDGCGAVEVEETPAPGHTVSEDEAEWIVVEADCLNGGSVTKPCTVCGQAAEVSETEALGHDWDEEFTDGGCMGVSTLTKTCLRDGCGETEREDFISPGHTVSEDEAEWIVVEADCLNGGSVTKPCTVCGQAAEVAETEALGHSGEILTETVDATCTAPGSVTKRYSVCGCVDSVETIPALEHRNSDGTEAWGAAYVGTMPTEDAAGTLLRKCALCGEETAAGELPVLDGSGFVAADGVLYRYVGDEAHVTIPEGITAIRAGAFDGVTASEIAMGDGVTEIDDGAITAAEGLLIRCNEGSAAEAYAVEHGISYGFFSDIVTSVPGDGDGNGKVNLMDVTLALQILADWEVEGDTDALDVNDDGKLNLMDVTLLLQYLADWDVVLK